MQIMGAAAVIIPALVLGILLWSVASRAVDAFTETYLVVDINFGGEHYDPNHPEQADYAALLRDGLRGMVPEADSRRTYRQLRDLFSDVRVLELESSALAVATPPTGMQAQLVLASDDADLYVKGLQAVVQRVPGAFPAQLRRTADGVRFTPVGDGRFEAGVQLFREHLLGRAARMQAEADRMMRGATQFEADAEQTTDAGRRDELLATAEQRRSRAQALTVEMQEMSARAASPDLLFRPDEETPSLLVRVADGIYRATAVAAQELQLEPIRVPTEVDHETTDDWSLLLQPIPESWRQLKDRQIGWLEWLQQEDRVVTKFNWRFFTAGNSREAELAGIQGALVGSLWALLVTLVLSVPVGVLAALYLEEFAPRNRLTDFIDLNINNLAAVPSIVFGLLGLAVFIQLFGIPRSVPLTGGIVLALMTLPTIVIASRASIAAVPQSIRDAALGVGASNMQCAFHHVLPPALPGIVTGVIIGTARAMGETAPLLLIGMLAFVIGVPDGPLAPSATLPVQIFQWSEFPEVAFANKAAATTLVLIVLLTMLNGAASYLRLRFESRK